MIVSGEKPEEYRETKVYWIARLCKKTSGDIQEIQKFTHARFRNGYSKNAPTHIREIHRITIGEGRPEWGALETENYFVIKLGESISRKTCSAEVLLPKLCSLSSEMGKILT